MSGSGLTIGSVQKGSNKLIIKTLNDNASIYEIEIIRD